MPALNYRLSRLKKVYPFVGYDTSRSAVKPTDVVPFTTTNIFEIPNASFTNEQSNLSFQQGLQDTVSNVYTVDVDGASPKTGNIYLSAIDGTTVRVKQSGDGTGNFGALTITSKIKFGNKNNVRYTYLKSNNQSIGLENKTNERQLATQYLVSDYLEVDYGTTTITSANSATSTFSITFSGTPTVIATTTDDVKLSVTVSTTTVTFQSSEIYTGTITWLAIRRKSDKISVRKVLMIIDNATETLSNVSTKTISFTANKFLGRGSPIVLMSANANVNLYISSVSETGFTVNSSDVFSGTVYWAAFVIQEI